MVKNPIALDVILKKCKKGAYSSLEEVKQDLNTMFENAQFYNEEGSWIYNDAEELRKFTDNWFETNT